jgi:hypothetical protein
MLRLYGDEDGLDGGGYPEIGIRIKGERGRPPGPSPLCVFGRTSYAVSGAFASVICS